MKKFMSMVLALALCLGLSTASFAQRKLYLANTPLDVTGDQEPYLEEDDTPTPGQPAPVNSNGNPSTGR